MMRMPTRRGGRCAMTRHDSSEAWRCGPQRATPTAETVFLPCTVHTAQDGPPPTWAPPGRSCHPLLRSQSIAAHSGLRSPRTAALASLTAGDVVWRGWTLARGRKQHTASVGEARRGTSRGCSFTAARVTAVMGGQAAAHAAVQPRNGVPNGSLTRDG